MVAPKPTSGGVGEADGGGGDAEGCDLGTCMVYDGGARSGAGDARVCGGYCENCGVAGQISPPQTSPGPFHVR